MDELYSRVQYGLLHKDALLSLFQACHAMTSRDDFVTKVYKELMNVIPHTRFACGTAELDTLKVIDSVNIGFPKDYLCGMVSPDRRISSPIIARWLQTRKPLYSDQIAEIGNVVIHGMHDLSGKAASYFAFAGLKDPWSNELRALIEIVVPQLHAALVRHVDEYRNPYDELLSRREREVLSLVCTGKTNTEIGNILGISHWTVKIHIRNLMAKLEVSTRAHAVAKAMQYGLGLPSRAVSNQ